MPDNPSSDDDYELEEVDAEVLEHERQRTERHVRMSEARAAQAEIYDQRDQPSPVSLEDFGPIRFTTRHLLIATAVLAIAMTLFKHFRWGIILVLWLVGLAAAWWYVLRREKQEASERERHRRELEARIAAADDNAPSSAQRAPQAAEADQELEKLLQQRPALSFNFSLKQMFVATTIAAVLLAISSLLGPGLTATALGLVAGFGLVLHLMGADPPPIIVFGWWVLLVLYILMSLLAAFVVG